MIVYVLIFFDFVMNMFSYLLNILVIKNLFTFSLFF